MNNLLLYKERQSIEREYRRRRVIVVLSMAILIALVAVILIATTYGTLWIKLSLGQRFTEKQITQPVDKELKNLESSVQAVRLALAKFNQLTQAKPVDILQEVYALRPSGIKISEFTYSHVDGKNYSVVLQGTATSRQGIADYLNALKASPRFTKVDSPLTNVIRGSGAPFSITLTVDSSNKTRP